MPEPTAKDRIIVALDVDNPTAATTLVEDLHPYVGGFKLGLRFISSIIASVISPKSEKEALNNLQKLRELFELLDGMIFWDGKFGDIPNTVGDASEVIAKKLNVRMFNVHASAGQKSIEAAVLNRGQSRVLGVTVLTSIDKGECFSIFGEAPGEKVLKFSRMLLEAGAQAIICSPQELELLGKHKELSGLLKITPGIRPEWAQPNDQERFATPDEAIKLGADYIVVGRPITSPPPGIDTPVDAVKQITEEIEEALVIHGAE